MARGIIPRWQINFCSMNGVLCHVDIYKEGYTGSATTQLTGAANPFEYQEDDDLDLLNQVRYRTGYIRVVETIYNELAGFAPPTPTAHYVVAYYGSNNVFTGYMKCEEYSSPFVANPRELEFPVVSPLGLLEGFKFAAMAEGEAPELISLGELMKEVVDAVNPYVADNPAYPGYQHIIYPTGDFSPWDYFVQHLVVCPFNPEFAMFYLAQNLYQPKDMLFFVKALCACFGYMVHDTPSGLVFVDVASAASSTHSKIAVEQLVTRAQKTTISSSGLAFNMYFDNMDDAARETVLQPVRELELSMPETSVSDQSVPTKYCKIDTNGITDNLISGNKRYKLARLTQKGPHVTSDVMMPLGSFGSSNGVAAVSYGVYDTSQDKSVSMSESWMIRVPSTTTEWEAGINLFTARFFSGISTISQTGNKIIIRIKIEIGSTLENLKASGWGYDIPIGLVIKSGDKYYDIAYNDYYSDERFNICYFDRNSGSIKRDADQPTLQTQDDIDGVTITFVNPPTTTLEVTLKPNAATYSALVNHSIRFIKISTFSVGDPNKVTHKFYLIPDNTERKILQGATGSNEKGSHEVALYNFATGANMILKADGSGYSSAPPAYPYMFKPLGALSIKQAVEQAIPPQYNEYVSRWTYWYANTAWRMLAHDFNLADDLHKIILIRSIS